MALRGAQQTGEQQGRNTYQAQKMQNPTVTACAAAPRFLKTLARAGSLRAASDRFLKTLGQNFSS